MQHTACALKSPFGIWGLREHSWETALTSAFVVSNKLSLFLTQIFVFSVGTHTHKHVGVYVYVYLPMCAYIYL